MLSIRIISTASLLALLLISAANAAPLHFTVATTVSDVQGSYVGDVLIGHTITGSFIVDDDTANSGPGSDPNPSVVPGHEYTAFWEFPGASYAAGVFNVDLGGGFDTVAPPHLVMNDDLFITSADTGGMVADGTYDWIELNASSTVDYCPEPGGICTDDQYIPADGEEWVLAIFSGTSWFSGGTAIPTSLPGTYTAFLIGIEFDATGNEAGMVLAPADTLSVSATAVPVPAAAWLFGSSLIGLGWFRRRQSSSCK